MVSTTVGNKKKNFQLFNRSSKAKKTNKQAANTLDLHVKWYLKGTGRQTNGLIEP